MTRSNESEKLIPRGLAPASPSSPIHTADSRDLEIQRLGARLALSAVTIQTLVSEHESTLDKLQSSAEQALTGNQELQRLNEELRTAKRGIVSINEVLGALNRDLQLRNLQLTRFNDDIQRGLDNANVLLDAVTQPLVILDANLRIEKANLAFHETFSTTAQWTQGRSLSEIGGGHWSTPELLTKLQAVLDTGAAVEEVAVETEIPRIGFRNMFVEAKRLHAERGAGARLLLAMEDRTEMTRSERGHAAVLAVEHEARERAEAADQVKDQFVATVSHELRGPLNVISGWMNILLGAGENPGGALLNKAMTAIGRGVAAQTRLVSDLLDHSRIAAGKVELQRAAIDLVTIAEAALMGVRAAADAKDIDIALSGNHTASIVLGDGDRMQQVLWNLFFNAVKFTPRGGSVRVSIGRIGNQVHVTVTDTGRGIPAPFLPYVFDRFRQADGSSNRNHGGLGLGLTLVRELVELHGGTVQAASDGEGMGATFTVVLPIPTLLLPAPESEHPQPLPESELPPNSWAPAFLQLPLGMLKGVRLLVVDDEADARDALVSLLERYGAGVRTAASVPEALAAVALELPDVLISDLGMAGEDGYELIRRVRLLAPDSGGRIPAVAVSAYATELHRQRMMSSGFHTYLEKPVAPAELVTEVARLAAL
jgi:two-component system, chemotaxis family, CheB/CheR fusion protein